MRLAIEVMLEKHELLILHQVSRETRALDSTSCTAIILKRRFQPSRLGAALVAMISLASGVWILLFDDLSSVVFRQPTTTFLLFLSMSS